MYGDGEFSEEDVVKALDFVRAANENGNLYDLLREGLGINKATELYEVTECFEQAQIALKKLVVERYGQLVNQMEHNLSNQVRAERVRAQGGL